jgi:hypothetical protein
MNPTDKWLIHAFCQWPEKQTHKTQIKVLYLFYITLVFDTYKWQAGPGHVT